MDGPHDLGGKEGFGPIDVNEEEEPFHHAWEGRMWGLAKCTGAPDWTIDWWRHVRELTDPVDYLSRPYFDSWMQTQSAAFIDSGVFTLDELISGKSATPPDAQAKVLTKAEAIEANRSQATRFDRQIETAPAFATGDRVMTAAHGHSHHTRLPAYARGRPGVIHAHHGAHVFADESARGNEVAQHIYSVMFEARDLWPEAGERKDRVYLDLWENYLEPA